MGSSIWASYPSDYRSHEVAAITSAVASGECAAVVGLSGAGKTNLLGFVAHRAEVAGVRLALIDCNRLSDQAPAALFRAARQALGEAGPAPYDFQALNALIERLLGGSPGSVCLLLDRLEVLTAEPAALFGNLRTLRDAHKYRLTYVIATRRPTDPQSELAELMFANTLWLGPLSASDARWTIARYAERKNAKWSEKTVKALIEVTRGYPSFLRAACEAHAAGAAVTLEALRAHPAMKARLEEFWSDDPTDDELRRAGLDGLALLAAARGLMIDTARLTAKEKALLDYLQIHAGEVCEKDDIIRAVWPEDKVYERGVRDDSLAQLVRRLRGKVEPEPSAPRFLVTVPGRGYRFVPAD